MPATDLERGVSDFGHGRASKPFIDPAHDVREDQLLIVIVEKVMKSALIKLEGFVCRAGLVIKVLATAWPGVFVRSPMQDQDWQRDLRELFFQSLVCSDHCGHRLRRLRFMGDQWIPVHECNCLRIARKTLVGKVKDMSVGCKVTEPLEYGESKIRSRQLMGEAFAN